MSKIVVINQDTCIGCNTCPLIDPDTFELDPDTFKAKVKHQPEAITDKVNSAISSCPVNAISVDEK
jgi:ferredoxin